jgi:UDP-N-acetylmuramoylalanine--D-glutamate ligase
MEDELLIRKGIEHLLDMRSASLAVHNGHPHSMEMVARIDDVAYVNDSKATFLDATLGSLSQLGNRAVWICGPLTSDLGQGYVQQLLEERVASVIVFGTSEEERDMLKPFNGTLFFAEELRTAVFLAREIAEPGQTVLFSPACPSGNGFANYEERGVEFKRAVRDL